MRLPLILSLASLALSACGSGSLPEQQWYSHYERVCARSGDKPLPLESFRRIAARHVPRIQSIDGITIYCEVLPNIPADA